MTFLTGLPKAGRRRSAIVVRRRYLAITLAAFISVTHADPLRLGEAVTQALTEQPALKGLERAAFAAKEAAVADAQLPDPRLSFGVESLPITGSDSLDPTASDMTMTTISFMQEMVRSDKREAAAARSRAEAQQWTAQRRALALAIRRDVSLVWLQLFLATQQQQLIAAKRQELQAEQSVTQQQLAADQATAPQILALQTTEAFLQDQYLKAQGEERIARAALARWLGHVVDRELPESLPVFPKPPALAALQEQLARHPAVLASRAAEAAAGHSAQLARVASQSDWSWEVMYGMRQDGRDDMIGVRVSVDLPWNQASRQDRRRASQQALAEQAQLATDDLLLQLRAELLEAWSAWEVANARVKNYETVLLPAARARVDTAQAGYRAGSQPLAQTWEARRSLLDMQLEALAAQVAQAESVVRLAYFAGEINDVAQ